MKKFFFAAAFICFSLIVSAKDNGSPVEPAQITQSQSAATENQNAGFEEDDYWFLPIHATGTITSSCGVVWNYVYDCPSDCTFLGSLENMQTMINAVNKACGTSITTIHLVFDTK